MRGEAGIEKKAQKAQKKLIACSRCGKPGGTLIKCGGWYIHEWCRSV